MSSAAIAQTSSTTATMEPNFDAKAGVGIEADRDLAVSADVDASATSTPTTQDMSAQGRWITAR